MLRFLPIVLEIALLIYALVDLLQSDANRIRNFPKAVWALLIIFVPFIGPLGWFLGGRPQRMIEPGPTRDRQYQIYEPPRPVAPDDDADFLRSLDERAADADLFKKWEDDLRRREEEFKNRDADGKVTPDDPDAPKP